jgi:hypothetical protein
VAVPLHDPALPRRDAAARAHLEEVARRAAPLVRAGERVLAVGGELGALIPGGGLRRGSVVGVDGGPGAGATSLALRLAASATDAGEWAAFVDPPGTLGGLAAAEAGVSLDRFAVVRGVPRERWAVVVAALLDGVALVVAGAPDGRAGVRPADARRLVARARERGSVLVVQGAWPAEAALRLRAGGGAWSGLGDGAGVLDARELRVEVEGRGVAARVREGAVSAGTRRAG